MSAFFAWWRPSETPEKLIEGGRPVDLREGIRKVQSSDVRLDGVHNLQRRCKNIGGPVPWLRGKVLIIVEVNVNCLGSSLKYDVGD